MDCEHDHSDLGHVYPSQRKAIGLRPVQMRKAGEEWVVELHWKTEAYGSHSTCGMFVSRNQDEAIAYLKNAERILDCWYVDHIWEQEGKI